MTSDHLQILREAVQTNKDMVKSAPTADNIRNWQASVRALEAAEAAVGSNGEECVKGIKELVKYLDGRGWKISTSTAYNHRDSLPAFPRADQKGCYLAADLDRYASENLRRKDGSGGDEADQDEPSAKQRAATSKEEQQAENWRIRNEILRGAYIERSFMEREFGSRAAFLRTDLNTFWEVHALTIVELVGGDPAKVPALVEKGQDFVRDWTDRYARAIKYPEPKAPAGEPID
jgi:hypothetical protein